MTGEDKNTSLLRNVRRDAAGAKDSVIQIRGLVNGFGSKVIHDHIDLDVYRGEVLGVVGGSGSGKSVLMRSIIGLIHPKEGDVRVFRSSAMPPASACSPPARWWKAFSW